ncbi:MAG: hypothetical protein GXY32_03640 [Ruminococcaceae bacterium]|nr:hypothetical protein [Oscillospiraceae bacterium]
MADNAYIRSLDGIRASDAFKQATIAKMLAAAQNAAASAGPAAKYDAPTLAVAHPNRRRNLRIGMGVAACLVVAVVALFATPLLRGGLGGAAVQNSAPAAQSTGEAMVDAADNAAPEAAMAAPNGSTATGGAEADGDASMPTSITAAEPEDAGGLPQLTVEENFGGMGFEGYMAYDIGDLVSANPWTPDANLTTLPVFTNTAPAVFLGVLGSSADADAMVAQAEAAASALGFTPLESTLHFPTESDREAYLQRMGAPMPEDAFYGVTLSTTGGTIAVGPDGLATIDLEPPVALPAGYSFTHHSTSYAQAQETLAYLSETYAELVGMQQPVQNISGGDYNIYAQRGFDLGLYEGAGDLTDQILAYHFNRISFYNDDNNALFIIRRWRTDLSEKLGDYPIITPEEAQDLLVAGHYITTVPEAMPGAEYIAKVELVYRTESAAEVFMPYYRFYVEIDRAEMGMVPLEGGLKTYGAYYVPAVAGEYIANMPLWDGSFN